MANQDEVRDIYGYFERKGNALCYRYEAERLVIEPWGKNSLRVRATKLARMDPEDWALLPPQEQSAPVIEARVDGGSITNGKICAEINLIGKLTFYNERGQVLLEEYVRNRKDMFGGTCSSDHRRGLSVVHALCLGAQGEAVRDGTVSAAVS